VLSKELNFQPREDTLVSRQNKVFTCLVGKDFLLSKQD